MEEASFWQFKQLSPHSTCPMGEHGCFVWICVIVIMEMLLRFLFSFCVWYFDNECERMREQESILRSWPLVNKGSVVGGELMKVFEMYSPGT